MGSRLLVLATAGGLLAAAVATAAPAPRLVSATVVGNRATLQFSAPLAPGRGRLTVTVNGKPAIPVRTTRSGRRIGFVLPQAVYSDDVVRVHGLGLRTRGGARLRTFAAVAANRSAIGCSQQIGSVAAGVATEGPTDLATFLPPRRLSVLGIAVDYADVPSYPSFTRLSLSTTDTWLRELSYGRAGVDETVLPGVVRMPKAWVDYAFTGPWSARKPLFQDLVLRLDGEVDFSRYDAVFVSSTHHFGHPEVRYEYPVLAPVGEGIVADGRELRHFGLTPDHGPGIGFTTTLRWLGLPTAAASHRWNLPGLFGWHRRKLGWLDPSQIRCLRDKPIETELTPLALSGGTKLILMPRDFDRTLVLENRQRIGLDTENYPCGRGILAYEIGTRPGSNPFTLLPRGASGSSETCGAGSDAPYDLRPGETTSISALVSVQILSQSDTGSYRLRVTR